LTFNDCDLNSLYSTWYVDINVGGNQLIQQSFFDGYGLNNSDSFPTQSQWVSALQTYLPQLNNYNLNYYISNSILYVQNLDCGQDFLNQTFNLNVGINFSLACN
jgi:hypothetical protein